MQELQAHEWVSQSTYCVAELSNHGNTIDLGKFQSNAHGHAEDNLIDHITAEVGNGNIPAGAYELLIILNRSPCSTWMSEGKPNGTPPCMTRLIDLQRNGVGGRTFSIVLNYRHLYGGNPSTNWNRAMSGFGVQEATAYGVQVAHGEGYYDVGVVTIMSQLES